MRYGAVGNATSASSNDNNSSNSFKSQTTIPPASGSGAPSLSASASASALALLSALRHENSDTDSETEDLLSHDQLVQRAQAFTLPNDPDCGYRGTELKLLSFSRPHMRAFHGSWICYFVNQFVQFAMAPLLPEVQKALHLTKSEIWYSNIWSMIGGVPMRFLLGPLSDKYGPRLMVTNLLFLIAVPCALSGFITTIDGLLIVRLAIGALDTSVPCQHWITCHFVRDISGTAMALTSGWGATGAGVTQVAMGSVLFSLMMYLTGNDSDLAWRLALVVPALLAVLTAAFFSLYSEDCPLGNYTQVKSAGLMLERSAIDSFRSSALNLNSWILFLQFAGSSGVDMTMCNGAAIYFHDRFQQTTAVAGAVAALYGTLAVFARGLGGWVSDALSEHLSMKGRLWAQMLSMILQGIFTIWWSQLDTLGPSIIMMVVVSILVQTSIGTCFSIVPYVDGQNTGSVAGIVGAGGNVGAIILGLKFRSDEYSYSVEYMGWFAIILALLTPLIVVKGYKGLLFGKDDLQSRQGARLIVPPAT